VLKPHLQYAKYVARHKWFVFQAGMKTGAPLWRLIIHDWSKLTPAEWNPYVKYFYTEDKDQESFDKAWLHHQHHNPHHWQHWLLREDDGPLNTLVMPKDLVREMVADWMGAGRAITGKWEVRSWYEKNAHNILLHSTNREQVETLLESVNA
jgi:hypothetical protein